MRKFFQEIKADLKFKTAGPGQKLSDPSRYGLGEGPPVTGGSRAGGEAAPGAAGTGESWSGSAQLPVSTVGRVSRAPGALRGGGDPGTGSTGC